MHALAISKSVIKQPTAPHPIHVLSAQLQQYFFMQLVHTPLRASPRLRLERSTTAHARHAGHSGSLLSAPVFAFTLGMPCVAVSNAASSIVCTCASGYCVCPVDVFVAAVSPSGGPPFAMYMIRGASEVEAVLHPKKVGRWVKKAIPWTRPKQGARMM